VAALHLALALKMMYKLLAALVWRTGLKESMKTGVKGAGCLGGVLKLAGGGEQDGGAVVCPSEHCTFSGAMERKIHDRLEFYHKPNTLYSKY